MADEAEKKQTKQSLSIPVHTVGGEVAGTITLPEAVFGVSENPALIAQAVRVYQANQRLGTHASKNRALVTGSTRKLFKQKGTGRARHGDIKSPIFVGGGTAHGPHPRDYGLDFPKKMRRLALFVALSERYRVGDVVVLRAVDAMEAKTKAMATMLARFLEDKQIKKRVMLVTDKPFENIERAGRNIANLMLRHANQLSVYETLLPKKLLFTEEAIARLADLASKKKAVRQTQSKPQKEQEVQSTLKTAKTPKTAAKKETKVKSTPKKTTAVTKSKKKLV